MRQGHISLALLRHAGNRLQFAGVGANMLREMHLGAIPQRCMMTAADPTFKGGRRIPRNRISSHQLNFGDRGSVTSRAVPLLSRAKLVN